MPATKHAIVQQLSFISEVDHATLRDQARAPSVAHTSSPLPFAKGEDEGEGFFSRSLLECEPDCPQDAVKSSANLMIPESQYTNSMPWLAIPSGFDHEFGPHGSYAPAVQLDSWLCARTIEIQDVIVERMLATKFVAREVSVP